MAPNYSFNRYNNRQFFKEFIAFFYRRNIISQLILVNLIVFLITAVTGIIFWLFQLNPRGIDPLLWWVAFPAEKMQFLLKPWSILTYMFVHEELMHFVINMLWLYWFGRIFQKFISSTKILGTYLIGGMAGALLFFLAYNFFPVFDQMLSNSLMIGASASIMAIVFTVSFYVPNHELGLFLIGRIKLKYIALIIFFIDVLAIGQANTGGHIAHIGGAIFGFLYGKGLRSGHDFIARVHSLFYPTKKKSRSKSKKTYPNADYAYKQERKDSQDRINEILDKISKHGYESLTQDEKKALFDSGNE